MNRKLFLLGFGLLSFTSLLSLIFLGSCQKSGRKTNSVLVIAVDQLAANDLDCNRESKFEPKPDEVGNEAKNEAENKVKSENKIEFRKKARPLTSTNLNGGIEILCQSSYRFSHFYTSSVLSVPAMVTLLTGQYPLAHAVHDNSGHLSPQIETSAERAFKKGFDTSFFSGGAPVLRKSGLNQGFGLFEDYIKLQPTSLHRPFKSSMALFKSRLKEIGSEPFFSVFYIPDLRFTDVPTTNSLGEPRNFSYESQLEEFDDSLNNLIQFLKTEKRWDSTHIILVGLNGRSQLLRKKLITPTNLHSENTQVALLWKPAGPAIQKPQTSNVSLSLADVGASIYEWIDGQASTSEIVELPTTTLSKAIQSTPTEPRWIASESGWAAWRWNLPLQLSIRKEQLLCLNEGKANIQPRCFNTVSDKDELFELPTNDTLLRNGRSQQIELLKKFQIPSLDPNKIHQPKVTSHNAKNLPCYQIFERGSFSEAETKKCDDAVIQDLLHWISAEQNPQIESKRKEAIRKKFLHSLSFEIIDRKVSVMQNQNDWIWDVPGHIMVEKSLLEQIFEIPELAQIRAQAYRALNQAREE